MDAPDHPFAATMLDLQIRVAELGLLDLASLDAEGTRAALAEIADIKQVADLMAMLLQ